MNKHIIALLFCFLSIQLFAHPWKPAHHVIIDTDCGIDDYRAICMLLAETDIRVLGIVTSDGVLDAETGYHKLQSLLADLHHEGILTGLSSNPHKVINDCPAARSFSWGEQQDSAGAINTAQETIEYILKNSVEPLDYICLGSLSTVADLYKESEIFRERINNIIWSSGKEMNENNFNYKIGKEAYKYIKEETNITLNIITGEKNDFKYRPDLVEKINVIGNVYAKNVSASVNYNLTPYARAFFDERVALYFSAEKLFLVDSLSHTINYELHFSDLFTIENEILNLMKGYTGNQNQVLNNFPLDTNFYQPDVRKIMLSTIEKYGTEEWISGVITNELHRHLGVYAIIGNKMGVRAREYFGAGIDEMRIVSLAGVTPPFSCMNDGLQVSTGATLGHGLISVASDTLKLPEAEFSYMGRKIKITLKEKYRKRIESEISGYRLVYGISSDMYWEMVRKAALSYWANWSRHVIFIINTDI